jgi:hypothetical protein
LCSDFRDAAAAVMGVECGHFSGEGFREKSRDEIVRFGLGVELFKD